MRIPLKIQMVKGLRPLGLTSVAEFIPAKEVERVGVRGVVGWIKTVGRIHQIVTQGGISLACTAWCSRRSESTIRN